MNLKLIKKTTGKKLIYTTVCSLTLGSLSPFIYPNTTSYALTTESTVLNNYKLSEFQNTFFDLIEFMDKNISMEKLRSKIKDLDLVKNQELDFNNMFDIYEKNNEQIKVYYNKLNKQKSYYAQNIVYKINI